MIAIWHFGSAQVSRPLPSFVTSTIEPVSAMAKFAPEMPTSASANFCRSARRANWASACALGRQPLAGGLAQDVGDLLGRKVNRRRDDVRRPMPGKLNDVFAEVGFDRFDAGRFERVIEMNLLAGHRLRFDDLRRLPLRESIRR